MKRKLKIIGLVFLGLFLLFITAGVIIGTVYQDEVRAALVSELQKNFTRKIIINDEQDIHFSIFSKFPKASLELNNITAPGIEKDAPPLLRAKKVFLMFDMLSIFTKNFEIDAVHVQEGEMNLGYEVGDRANFLIWKETPNEEGESDGGVEVNLTMINLDDIKFSYFNQDAESKYTFLLEKIDLYPVFNETNIAFASEGTLALLKMQNPDFLFEKTLQLEHHLRGGNFYFETDKLEMREIELDIEDKITLNGNGSIINKKDGIHFDLKAASEKTDIGDILAILPANYLEDISSLKPEGESSFDLVINNVLNELRAPNIKVNFDAKEVKFLLKEENLTFDDIDLKGHYTFDGESVLNPHKININRFALRLGDKSIVKGELAISEMRNPQIKLKGTADISLEDLQKKIALKNVEEMSGNTHTTFDFQGKLADIFIEQKTQYLDRLKSDGEVVFNNVNVKLVDDPNQYKNIHGKISFNNRDFAVDSLMGMANSSDFSISGKIPDIYLFLLGKADFKMSASVKSNTFNMDELLSETESSTDDDYKLSLPQKTTLQLNFDIGHFIFRKFEASNVQGDATLEDQVLRLNDFNCGTSEGQAKINGFVDAAKNDKITFECNGHLEKINVKTLFYQFENFGQDFIMDKHIEGLITSNIFFKAEADTNLNIDLKKMYTRAHLKIENGKLIELPSMVELDEFLAKEYKMKNLNLGRLSFATLENDIEIVDQVIIIPNMTIKSSAMNVDIAGEHGFDEKINYKFRIKSSQLINAYRKKKKDNNEFMEQEEDQSQTIPFFMKGTIDNPEFGYDKNTKKEIAKSTADEKKNELRDAFRKEFGEKEITDKKESKKEEKKEDKKQEVNQPRLGVEWNGE